ncbi:MAG: GDSL-type esterase/lipase family protein [bacterium]
MKRFSLLTLSRQYPRLTNTALVLFSVLFALILCELGFRFVLWGLYPETAQDLQEYAQVARDRNTRLIFQPHPYLSYNRTDTVLDDLGIRINNQFFTYEKPEKVIRVACLGGSTTMNAYPHPLGVMLNRLPGERKFEVMDFGCNAWTLMESTINYLIRVSHFQPDIVIVHHGVNDSTAQRWDQFRVDYTNFRKHWSEQNFSPLKNFLAAHSRLLGFILLKYGMSAVELHNYVYQSIHSRKVQAEAPPLALKTYEHLLQQLHALTSARQAQLILAPMAYSRSEQRERDRRGVEANNQVMRRFAFEYQIPLVESDRILLNHQDWFYDLVHVQPAGDYLKALLFTREIQNILNGVKPQYDDLERVLNPPPTVNPVREIILSWDFHADEVMDYHIMVRVDRQKGYTYLGRTDSPDVRTFTWKTGEPQLSPVLKEEFKPGPRIGQFYNFMVVPFKKGTKQRMHNITCDNGLRVMERVYD